MHTVGNVHIHTAPTKRSHLFRFFVSRVSIFVFRLPGSAPWGVYMRNTYSEQNEQCRATTASTPMHPVYARTYG